MSTKLLTIHQVQTIFGVKSRQTIYNWVEKGTLPEPVKKWGSPRWNESEISDSFEKQPVKTNVPEGKP
jgi:predicted DNA-binding transcriptional regulator AlpA